MDGVCWVECLRRLWETLRSVPAGHKLGVVAHACSYRTLEEKMGRSEVHVILSTVAVLKLAWEI